MKRNFVVSSGRPRSTTMTLSSEVFIRASTSTRMATSSWSERSQRNTEYCIRSPYPSIQTATWRSRRSSRMSYATRYRRRAMALPRHQRLVLRQLAGQAGGQDTGLQLDRAPVADRVAEQRMPQVRGHPPLPGADHRLAAFRGQGDRAGAYQEVGRAHLTVVDE